MSLFGDFSLFGYVLLVISYSPQYLLLYKKKCSDQLSLLWPGVIFIACVFMEPLALTGGLVEYAVGNSVAMLCSALLCCQILYYRRGKPS